MVVAAGAVQLQLLSQLMPLSCHAAELPAEQLRNGGTGEAGGRQAFASRRGQLLGRTQQETDLGGLSYGS
jgi:hypothetical protein